jgi:hypothetical protein
MIGRTLGEEEEIGPDFQTLGPLKKRSSGSIGVGRLPSNGRTF